MLRDDIDEVDSLTNLLLQLVEIVQEWSRRDRKNASYNLYERVQLLRAMADIRLERQPISINRDIIPHYQPFVKSTGPDLRHDSWAAAVP